MFSILFLEWRDVLFQRTARSRQFGTQNYLRTVALAPGWMRRYSCLYGSRNRITRIEAVIEHRSGWEMRISIQSRSSSVHKIPISSTE